MEEKERIVTMGGNPLTLLGREIKVGEKAPDCVLIDNDLAPVRLSSFWGQPCIISSVPSLDTPVCDLETKRFDAEVARFDFEVTMLTISMDLPFAQKRWCGATGTGNSRTLSDHREAAFGMAYGVLIKELRLLARALFVADNQGVVCYTQLVREISQEPDYDAVLAAVTKIGRR
ncbi:MAG: thiol peroxidase [Deltaproteobacteria bacterium]|nr:thiol peroxidase [Deltaproteobacteria bacterium]